MRKRAVLATVLLLAFVALGLYGCGSQPATTTTGADFSGSWDSPEWGAMELKQDGTKVTGTYVHDDGQIEGTVDGQKLTFKWWELQPKGVGFDKADAGERGDGYLTLSDDKKSIAGQWRYDGSQDWSGTWTATKK